MQFPRQRLSKEVVEKVEELLEKNNTYSQIAKQTGVSKASISKIKNGTYKKAPPHQRSIDEENYIALEKKFIELNKKYTKLNSLYINIYKQNMQLKKENIHLRKYNNDIKRFESSINKLEYYIYLLCRYTKNFNKINIENNYYDNRSVNVYYNNNSIDTKQGNNNLID